MMKMMKMYLLLYIYCRCGLYAFFYVGEKHSALLLPGAYTSEKHIELVEPQISTNGLTIRPLQQGMLGSTANGRLMGPGVGSSTSSSSSSSSSSTSSSLALAAAAAALQQQPSHTPHPQHQLGHHPFPGHLPAHHHLSLQPQHPALAAAHHHHHPHPHPHHHHRSIWPSLGAAATTGRTAFELQTATNGEGDANGKYTTGALG
uniref:Uncharacterized protein n=1 Tax=Anopheles epiroticus TaxID=199890 RepID=A0A182PHY6_9DIPT